MDFDEISDKIKIYHFNSEIKAIAFELMKILIKSKDCILLQTVPL